jgi:hypothetical protein
MTDFDRPPMFRATGPDGVEVAAREAALFADGVLQLSHKIADITRRIGCHRAAAGAGHDRRASRPLIPLPITLARRCRSRMRSIGSS